METKEGDKNEKKFAGFGKKVDQFLDELNEAGEKLQKEFQQRYDELKDSAEKLKKRSREQRALERSGSESEKSG